MKKTLIAIVSSLALVAPAVAQGAGITDRLTPNQASIEITSEPAGTDHIGVAVMKTLSGEGVTYGINLPATTKTYTPPAGSPVVDIIAKTSANASIGSWAGRLQTVPGGTGGNELAKHEAELSTAKGRETKLQEELTSVRATVRQLEEQIAKEKAEPPPKEEPPLEEPPHEEPFSTFHKGVDGGGWGLSNELTDYKKLGPNPSVRLENPGSTSNLTSQGIYVTYLLNHYSTGGVKSINVAAYVKEAEAEVTQNPTDALEVLNEPGGNWFWGSGAESEANAAAYDALLKAVHEHIHGVQIEASFDGGHAGDNAWGRKMLKADPHVVEYATTFTEHPYDGASANPASTLVHWGAVQEAHELTGKPISITEYGRPLQATTGDSPKSTEAQQAAADGAMVKKAREVGWVREVDIYGYRGDGAPCYAVFAGNGTPRPAVAAIAGG